jgi:SAM-dependent methyltransferase
VDDSLRENQHLWDAWTRIHVGSAFYDVASFVDGSHPIRIADYERDEVGPVEGRTLLHLQCHFGLDTLSWARLGARVTGIDFSSEAVAAARALARDVGVDARFIQSNLYDAPAVLDEEFDVVYTSRGVLGWLPDIPAWARVAARFVRPGGTFYVTEIHPVAQVFAEEGVAPGELRLGYPYWSHPEPLTFDVKGSYADPAAPTEGLVEHGWDHSLGEIVTALVDAGLQVDFLHEHPFVEWPIAFLVRSDDGRYRLPPDAKGELPLFFSLRAHKPSDGAATDGAVDAADPADTTAARRLAADELHDVAGQSLVAASRFVEAARSRGLTGEAADDLARASDQLTAAMREVRAVMDSLSPPALASGGVGGALRAWAERRSLAGFRVSVRGDVPRDEPARELAWFDLATRAATLLHRAAPVSTVEIVLGAHGDRRIMAVTGQGVPALSGGPDRDEATSLAWIRRTAARLGGTAAVLAPGGTGAGLVLDVPSTGTAHAATDDLGDG